ATGKMQSRARRKEVVAGTDRGEARGAQLSLPRTSLYCEKKGGRKPRHYNTVGLRFATIALMAPNDSSDASLGAASVFTAADVLAVLRERAWLAAEPSAEQQAWCEHAASMLGGHAADRAALADLLGLVFHYDAREIISRVES